MYDVPQYYMDRRQAALELAKLGLPVFPIKAGQKAPPLVAGWPDKATADPAVVGEWFGKDSVFGDANIGVHCEGLLVIDVDAAKGGRASLEKLDLLFGVEPTRTARTPTGGEHIIYRLPAGHPGVPNSVESLGPGLDIRSTNGYIVGVGSSRAEGDYTWQNHLPIATAPDWLVQKCGTFMAREQREKVNIADIPDAPADVVARAEAWLRTAPRSVKGAGGDQTAFRVAAALRDRGLSYQQACELMRSEAWDYGCGWRDGWLEEKPIRSAYRYAQNTPGVLAVSSADFPAIQAAPPTLQNSAPASHLQPLSSFASVHGAAPYLIKGLLSKASYAVMYGPPGEGKTFTALDIAYHVAAGQPWMERRVRSGTVLYLAYEGAGGLRRRAQALMQHYGRADLPLYFDDTPYNLRELEGRRALGATISSLPEAPALVVIDTFAHALCGGDENSAQDVSAFNAGVAALIKHTGACVMVIHHPPKSGNGPRGSSALHGAIDTELEVNSRRIVATKQRDVEIGDAIWFKLRPIALGIDEDGDEITSCVVLAAEPGEVAPDRRKATGTQSIDSLAFDVLCRLTPNGEPISGEDWQAACDEFLPTTASSRRTAWYRIRTKLEKRELITDLGENCYKRRLA